MSSTAAQPKSRVSSAIAEQRGAANEQLAAAWNLQISRVENALNTVWQEHIQRVLNDRFTELAERIQRELEAERRETAEEFGRALRRFAGSADEGEWGAALLESTASFCPRAVLLGVRGQSFRVLCVRGPAEGAPAAGLQIPMTAAPAAAATAGSRDALVTVTTAAEISPAISAFFERAGAANCAIVPVPASETIVAVLIAAGEGMDVSALEAMAALAGAVFTNRLLRGGAGQPSEDASHLRAQRFARVRAAEILLYKPQAVRDGRTRKKLYTELKEEIDSARAAYAREFLHMSSSMPDYLHLELLRTLANEEVAALGEEYPGPLA